MPQTHNIYCESNTHNLKSYHKRKNSTSIIIHCKNLFLKFQCFRQYHYKTHLNFILKKKIIYELNIYIKKKVPIFFVGNFFIITIRVFFIYPRAFNLNSSHACAFFTCLIFYFYYIHFFSSSSSSFTKHHILLCVYSSFLSPSALYNSPYGKLCKLKSERG